MDIREKWEIYYELCGGANAMESITLANETGAADLVCKLADAGLTKEQILGAARASTKKEMRGRKLREVENSKRDLFCKYVMGDCDEVQASNIDDALTGVCRLFSENNEQKRSGLSPEKLKKVMTYGSINSKTIGIVLGVGDRQARRYMKGAEMLLNLVERKIEG